MRKVRNLTIAMALLATACGGDSDVETSAIPAATTTVTTTSGPASTTTTSSTPTSTTTPPTTTTTLVLVAPPEWAAGYNAELFVRFLQLVESYMDGVAVRHVTDVDGGVVVLTVEQFSLGLLNLSQEVIQADPDGWTAIVDGHFDRIFETIAANPGVPPTWEAGQSVIRVRMYDELFFEAAGGGADTLRREVSRGVYATVVLDLPTAVRPIRRFDVAPWGVDDDEIFATALANTIVDPDLIVEPFVLDTGVALVSLYDSFYSSTFSLQIDDFVDDVGEAGVLLIFPVRDNLVVHVIVDQGAMDAFEQLAMIADGWYADGPASLSPFVYWWRDGELTELGRVIEGVEPALSAGVGQEFTDLIAGLA